MGKLFPQASGIPGQLVSARLVQLGNGIFCYHFTEDEGTGRSRNLPQGSQLGSGRAGLGPEASRCEEHAHTPTAHHQTLVQGARGQGASVRTWQHLRAMQRPVRLYLRPRVLVTNVSVHGALLMASVVGPLVSPLTKTAGTAVSPISVVPLGQVPLNPLEKFADI